MPHNKRKILIFAASLALASGVNFYSGSASAGLKELTESFGSWLPGAKKNKFGLDKPLHGATTLNKVDGLRNVVNDTFVQHYMMDMTTQAQSYSRVVGQSEPYRQLLEKLVDDRYPFIMLVGGDKAGRNSLVQHLAKDLADKQLLDPWLNGRRIHKVNFAAGLQDLSKFNTFIKAMAEAMQKNVENTIFYVDSIDTLARLPEHQKSMAMEAFEMIQSSGGKVVFRTENPKMILELSGKNTNSFASVTLKSLKKGDIYSVLKDKLSAFETKHQVKVSDEMLLDVVDLSDRFLAGKPQPGWALWLLEAGMVGRRTKLQHPELMLKDLDDEISDARGVLDFESSRLKDPDTGESRPYFEKKHKIASDRVELLEKRRKALAEQVELLKKYIGAEKEGAGSVGGAGDSIVGTVISAEKEALRQQIDGLVKASGYTTEDLLDFTKSDLADVLVKQFNVKKSDVMKSISKDEIEALKAEHKSRIIGHRVAIDELWSQVSRIWRSGRARNKVPSFLFLGVPGTGKTETVRQFIDVIGAKEVLERGSDFVSESDVTMLRGSAPSFVGYEEGSKLYNAFAKNSRSILLLDEVEKGHPSLQNFLLDWIQSGRLQSPRQIDPEMITDQAMMMATANTLKDWTPPPGFYDLRMEERKQILKDAVKAEQARGLAEGAHELTDPFLDRMTAIFHYRGLDAQETAQLVQLQFRKGGSLFDEFEAANIEVSVSDEVFEYLTNRVFLREGQSARGAVENLDQIVSEVLHDAKDAGEVVEGYIYRLVIVDDELQFVRMDVSPRLQEGVSE